MIEQTSNSGRLRPFRWAVELIGACIVALAVVDGCGRPAPAVSPTGLWMSGGDGPTPDYRNWYEAQDRYPGYAIVTYRINEPYARNSDPQYFAEAIRQCRGEYESAYLSKKLQRYSMDE